MRSCCAAVWGTIWGMGVRPRWMPGSEQRRLRLLLRRLVRRLQLLQPVDPAPDQRSWRRRRHRRSLSSHSAPPATPSPWGAYLRLPGVRPSAPLCPLCPSTPKLALLLVPPLPHPFRSNPGYIQPSQGQTSCTPCAAGTFAAAPGSTVCNTDPSGSYTGPAAGSLNWCPGGYVSNLGNTACVPCPSGFWRGGDATPGNDNACDRVPAGYFADANSAAQSISLCVPGTASSWSNTSEVTTWKGGDPQPIVVRYPSDATVCQACLNNNYAPNPGSEDCPPCPFAEVFTTTNMTGQPVSWIPGTMMYLQTGCKPLTCAAIYYLSYSPDIAEAACLACPGGSEIIDAKNAKTCTPCNPGEWRQRAGCAGFVGQRCCGGRSRCCGGTQLIWHCFVGWRARSGRGSEWGDRPWGGGCVLWGGG